MSVKIVTYTLYNMRWLIDDQDVSALTSSLEHARTECAEEQEGRAGDASNAAATAAELMLGSEAFGEECEILAQKEASTIQKYVRWLGCLGHIF